MNPISTQSMDLFIGIGGFLIVSLLGIIIYFIKNFHMVAERNMVDTSETLAELKIIISEHKITISEFRAAYNLASGSTESRLRDNTIQLNNHENRISSLETQCRIEHYKSK